jgi:lipid-A-disaccharide synthase-like uncharacterized protein
LPEKIQMLESLSEIIRSAFHEQLVKDPLWGALGFAGQAVFGARFIVQWIVSEYKKKSCVPRAFWYISIVGSFMLLCYSFHIRNAVFILGFSLNIFIYLRNIHLIYKHARTGQAAVLPDKGT